MEAKRKHRIPWHWSYSWKLPCWFREMSLCLLPVAEVVFNFSVLYIKLLLTEINESLKENMSSFSRLYIWGCDGQMTINIWRNWDIFFQVIVPLSMAASREYGRVNLHNLPGLRMTSLYFWVFYGGVESPLRVTCLSSLSVKHVAAVMFLLLEHLLTLLAKFDFVNCLIS